MLWIISHIFAYDSSSVEACVQQGIADTLLEFFGSPEVQLREMSVLAVSNMCGDSAKIRQFLIKKKNLIQVITDVLIKMPSQGSSELMDNLASLIRNIFGKDNLKPEAVSIKCQRIKNGEGRLPPQHKHTLLTAYPMQAVLQKKKKI